MLRMDASYLQLHFVWRYRVEHSLPVKEILRVNDNPALPSKVFGLFRAGL